MQVGHESKPSSSTRASSLHSRATIGIITALPKEFSAVETMLDSPVPWSAQGQGAGRRFTLGEIPSESSGPPHVVALALMPDVGTNSAAITATNLLRYFPTVRHIIMCGIAGGIALHSSPEDDIRLGDIVVSNKNGVVNYDFIKQTPDEIQERTPPRPPGAELLEAVGLLEAKRIRLQRPWESFLTRAKDLEDADRPPDTLGADGKPIEYPVDPKRRLGLPRLFYGPIASANRLLKDERFRDSLRERFHTKAVEMEGSGVADATWFSERAGYLVVRGICDFCDMRKGDLWQGYAAVAAAAYVRALLESMPSAVSHEDAPASSPPNFHKPTPTIPKPVSRTNTTKDTKALFDIYEPRFEPYYLEREADRNVAYALTQMGTWVSGPPGVGKTSAIRRALHQSEREFAYIGFANCFEKTANNLLLHAYTALADICRQPLPPSLPTNTSDTINLISSLLATAPKYEYIYIDELPTDDSFTHREFTRALSGLILTHSRRSPNSPLRYVVSSIHSAIGHVGETQRQVFERVRPVQFDRWTNQELQELTNLITNALPLELPEANKRQILDAANGSPRFIKSCFRKLVDNPSSSRWPIERIVSETSRELL